MKKTKSRYAILGMLSICPMSGYDIKKTIEESISEFWSESYGQIYPILRRLVADELVIKTVEIQSGKPDRHVYELTKSGHEELQRWLGEGVAPKVQRNELLLKLFFGGEVAAKTSLKHVEQYREVQLQLLEKYSALEKEIKSKYAGDRNSAYWLMTLQHGKHVSHALVNWCDQTLVKLNKMVNPAKNRRTKKKKSNKESFVVR
jgi:PadR family transcriptional regulator, regulatory protein AphA